MTATYPRVLQVIRLTSLLHYSCQQAATKQSSLWPCYGKDFLVSEVYTGSGSHRRDVRMGVY